MSETRKLFSKKSKEKELQLFIHNYFSHLHAMAMRYVNSYDIAQDIAQDVIIKYWQSKDHNSNIQSIENYLFILVRNECLNHIKKQNRELKKVEEANAFYQPHEESTLNKMIEDEFNMTVLNALNILPPQSKKIIELFLEGKKNKEISEILKIKEITVRKTKYLAISKLKEYFATLEKQKQLFLLFFFKLKLRFF